MHVFAILLFFGLGVMVVARLAERFLMRAPEMWAASMIALGVAFAWIADLDIWRLWGIDVRAGWIGVTATGLALGGVGYVWHTTLGLFSGLQRKVNDEAASMEKTAGLRAA